MRLIFVFKCSKFHVYFKKRTQNSENTVNFGDNCTLIGCVKDSLLPRDNTCHSHSTCYQIVSRFQILLTKNFFELKFFQIDMTKI